MDLYQKKSRQRHSCIKEKYVSKVMIYLLHLTSRFWQKILRSGTLSEYSMMDIKSKKVALVKKPYKIDKNSYGLKLL